MKVDLEKLRPHPKVLNSALAGALTTILIGLVSIANPDYEFSPGLSAAITTVIMAVFGFITSSPVEADEAEDPNVTNPDLRI